MNKQKMGQFLKDLRTTNQFTRKDLIMKLREENLEVTAKSIVNWEGGESIPELEKLVFLAKLYGVSVDEILEGERRLTKETLTKKYPLFSKEFYHIRDNKVFLNLRTQYTKELNKRFRYLIKKVYVDELTHNERMELAFIFEHKCQLTDYCFRKSNDEFNDFYDELKQLKANPTITSFNEFWWETQKRFVNSGKFLTSIEFYCIQDEEVFTENPFVQYLIEDAEPWEMDMLVAGLQNFDPIVVNADNHSRNLARYKEQHGKEFDREAIFKSTLKLLLTHGGMLNPYFYNFSLRKKKKIRVIDRLEELYKLCLRPIGVYAFDEEKPEFQRRMLIENTAFNRFLNQYYSFLFGITDGQNSEGLNPRILYDLVVNDADETKIVDVLCRYKNIDTNRDRRYILADLDFFLNSWRGLKNDFLKREEEIRKGLIQIRKLEALLKDGDEFYEEPYIEEIGPKEVNELKEWVMYWKQPMSLKEFNHERDRKLTEQLLSEIDALSVQEIRDKYFFMETQEGDGAND